MAAIRIEIDGSSRNNPGPSGIGVNIVGDDGTVIREISRPVGIRTNNQAEYDALIRGLEEARAYAGRPVIVQTDSELLYRQLTGRYRVKNPGLKPLHARAEQLLAGLPDVTLKHVPREQNRAADRLAQRASKAGTAEEVNHR